MEDQKSRFLHTLLREDVFQRLQEYCKSFATGQGNWDFGVGIERLLDYAEISEEIKALNARLDNIELDAQTEELQEEEKKKEKSFLIGRHGEKNGEI